MERDHVSRYRDADKLSTECVVNLIRTEGLLAAELDDLFRGHGLTGPGFNVLMILDGARDPLSPYEIGERLLVTRGTVTGLLDTLENRDLLRRVPHPKDRRRLLIELTPDAAELLDRVRRELFPAQTEMMSALKAREMSTVLRLLGKLQTHLKAGSGKRAKNGGPLP